MGYSLRAAEGCRLSSNKISASGKGNKGRQGNWEWKPQTATRLKNSKKQLVLDPTHPKGYQLITIHKMYRGKDGKIYGHLASGDKMVRVGWAYSLTRNNHTPGRWVRA